MISRKRNLFLLALCSHLLIDHVRSQGERAYDTSEWIPITPQPLQASASEIVEQKTASDRVLNLDAPAQQFNFQDEEYEYRKRKPTQVQQFSNDSPGKKQVNHPKPRNLKHPSEYKFETPPPPPARNQPQINYYNGESLSPYVFEQPQYVAKPTNLQQDQQNYYVPIQQTSNQRPAAENYVPVPSVNPQAPEPNAPNHYEQYHLPFNTSFYESLNPTSINNEFYQAITNNTENVRPVNSPIDLKQQNLQTATDRKPPVSNPSVEQQTVQLVYVPVENLKSSQQTYQNSRPLYQQPDTTKNRNGYTQGSFPPQVNQVPAISQTLEPPTQEKLKSIYSTPILPQNNEFAYRQSKFQNEDNLVSEPKQVDSKQARLQNIEQDFIQRAVQAHKLQQQLRDDINPLKQEISTTEKPKRKPHQPPLAVFLESQMKAEIHDVLNILKGAKTIAVQDKVRPDSPRIFIGPSNLDSPDRYTKFPLPYLNNINGNRIERKIDQLPFFVAPVSYKTPPGYAKIPLPSPHVGSVVVSIPVTSTTPEPIIFNQNQLNPYSFSPSGYSTLDAQQTPRQPQNILSTYDISDPSGGQYQNVQAPQFTASTFAPPIRGVYENTFTPRPSDVHYTQQQNLNEQTYQSYVPQVQEQPKYTLQEQTQRPPSSTIRPKYDSREQLHFVQEQPKYTLQEQTQRPPSSTIRPKYDSREQIHFLQEQPKYTPQEQTQRPPSSTIRPKYDSREQIHFLQEQQKYTPQEQTQRPPSSTIRPKYDSREPVHLPEVNPLELAINEFEQQQITGQYEEHNKVKHSTTRRPQTSYNEKQAIPRTRTPQSRGRYTYENEPTTERTSPRGRVRGRGRNGTSRTTTTTTTALPVEPEKYTVLEEFAAKEPPRTPPSESFRDTSVEVETESPRRPSNSFRGNQYLPEENVKPRQRPNIQSSRPKAFDYSLSQIQFENPKIQSEEDEQTTNQPEPSVEDQGTQNNKEISRFTSGAAEIENIPANVYTLGQQQIYDFDTAVNPQSPTRLVYENIEQSRNTKTDEPATERASPQQTTQSHIHRFTPEFVSYENREPNQRRPQNRPHYEQYEAGVNDEFSVKQLFEQESYKRPQGKIQEQVNEEPKQQTAEVPSGYLENLFQPNFDQTYISLQDQAVRSLLSPNLLAPTTKQDFVSTSTVKEIFASSTEPILEVPSSTEPETTTTTRATRTRGRGRARVTTSAPSATSSPRRSSGRRRPVSRTTTERVSSTTANSYEDNGGFGSNLNQRSRSRSRPAQNEISTRISTTEDNIRYFEEPDTKENVPIPNDQVRAVNNQLTEQNNQETPQSYIQFEHSVDQEQVITVNPLLNQDYQINEYPQVYNLPPQTNPENQQRTLEYENVSAQPKPILDVNVAHIVPEENQHKSASPEVTTEEQTFPRHNNANIKSGGVLINNKPEATTRKATTKTRGRTRGRSRFATSTTTSRPVTRISTRPTNAPTKVTTAKEEQEFYGFTRQPNYRPTNLNIQAQKLNPSSTRNEEQSVQFVGEIRPKYSQRSTTSQPSEDQDNIETPRPRIRPRTRAPVRKTSGYRQSDNDVPSARGSEQVTRRSGITGRTRSRGSTHYRVPENVKRESDEEDFANQNYPANFLQKLDISSSRPTTSSFQITLDPLNEEIEDQSPHSSFYRPKIVAKPDEWTQPNSLPSRDKEPSFIYEEATENQAIDAAIQITTEPQALSLTHSTEATQEEQNSFIGSEVDKIMADLEKIQTSPTEQSLNEQPTTRKKIRRKGAWKLIKQRPLDPLEVSESQNYQTVLNAFGAIQKVDPYSKSATNAEKSDSRYSSKEPFNFNIFLQELNNDSRGNPKSDNSDSNDSDFAIGTTEKDLEKFSTSATSTEFTITESVTEINMEEVFTTTPSPIKTQENIFNAIYEMFGIFDKAVEKNNQTEAVSMVSATTTVVNPTFPEEITDSPTTTSAGETTRMDLELTERDENNDGDSPEDKDKNNENLETTANTLSSTAPLIKSSTKPYEVEPWEMKEVKTSTSTEISHETEICYKGRCVKSKDKTRHK